MYPVHEHCRYCNEHIALIDGRYLAVAKLKYRSLMFGKPDVCQANTLDHVHVPR